MIIYNYCYLWGENMLIETAKKYYDPKYDLNCSETILYTVNEEYNLGLNKQTLRVASGFGGGMAIGSTCGVITGAVAVIGIMFTKNTAHKDTLVKELTKEFMEKFKNELGEYNCDTLKEKYKKDEETRCIKMIEISAKILEEIVQKNKSNINN
jgi:C_GCAxxG_C_C family probable redox protein